MGSIKWGLIAGGAGFVLAFIFSLLLGHTAPLTALFRAFFFTVFFFCVGFGARRLISSFIPELLFTDSKNKTDAVNTVNIESVFGADTIGSRVDVTVDDRSMGAAMVIPSAAALPDTDSGSRGVVEVEDIANLASKTGKDIDQSQKNGYDDDIGEFDTVFDDTATDVQGDFSLDFGTLVAESGAIGGTNSGRSNTGVSEEPEVSNSFMDSFALFSDNDDSVESESSFMTERQSSRHKPEKLDGDFSPKEIAAGIRTVLEKGKRG